MKYLTLCFVTLVLAFSIDVSAQGDSSNTTNSKSCGQYKIGIVTPSKEIDFKIIVIVPPKNLDQAMVFNPCPEQNQRAAVPQVITPRKETKEFFKVPPFTVKNRYSQ